MTLSRPIQVGPLSTTWECTTVSSPISTSGPTQVQGPMVTLRPSLAFGSTFAWGSIMESCSGRFECAQNVGLAHQPFIDAGATLEAPDIALVGIDLRSQHHSISRHYRTLESHPVDKIGRASCRERV